MAEIIGRVFEKEKLELLFKSEDPEFIAIYGRRRVGKTFLITEFFRGKGIFFTVTGQYKASIKQQLKNFTTSLNESFIKGINIQQPSSWSDAFDLLKKVLQKKQTKKKIILFFDEVPWLSSKRSGFISELEYFWNTWASQQKSIKLIVCGSAASWMIQNIVNSKGGLHNRITASIRLLPFDLSETKKYLLHRGIKFSQRQILDVYMAMGGIPHYLRQVKKGMSATQNINEVCFRKDGLLVSEFDRLFDSLFENSKIYKKVILALSKSNNGLLRNELLDVLNTTPGGTLNRILVNLEEAGFITCLKPYGKITKGSRYILSDEYSIFYLKWIDNCNKSILEDPHSKYWNTISNFQRFKVWSGYVFEIICFKHIRQIKNAIGISGIISNNSSWYIKDKSGKHIAQIDMLFDRNDNVISVCEVKCYNSEFIIDKKYSELLKKRVELFISSTQTKKSIHQVFITTSGVKQNSYYHEYVDNEVFLNDLFRG